MHWIKLILLWLSVLLLSACTSISTTVSDRAPDVIAVDIASIANAIPIYEHRTRAGNPESYEVFGQHYTVLKDSKNYVKKGIASWYGTKFHGKKTSNGETYDMFAMSAAHKTLPIPCYVQVTNLNNQRSVVVRINDRGPFHADRVIDLSYVAAVKLGIAKQGTALVEVRSIEPDQNQIPYNGNKLQATKPLYLQVGAFSQQANALKIANQIHAHDITHYRILSTNASGNQVHKVQVGPLHSLQETENLIRVLTDLGFNNNHLVIDSDQ